MIQERGNPERVVIRGPLEGTAFVVHRDAQDRLWVATPAIKFTHDVPEEQLSTHAYGFVAFCLRPGASYEQAMALAGHLSDLADMTAFAASFQEDVKAWGAVHVPDLDTLSGSC